MMQVRIGLAGLGKMGTAFTHRLLEERFQVSVWDRSPQRITDVAAIGALPCPSLDALVAAVDVVIVMLWGDDVAREVTLGQILPSIQRPQLLIEMSTLSPDMYDTLERAAQARNIDFVAAPVLGNPDAASQGMLTVLAGGAREPLERARAVLASLGTVIDMPSVRASGFLKLMNNTILGVVAETLGELLEVCDRVGIDRELAVRSLTGAFQRSIQQKLPQLLVRDSAPRFSLDALFKDLNLSREAAKTLGFSVPVLEAVLPQAERAVKSGLGGRDYIVLALDGRAPASSSPTYAART